MPRFRPHQGGRTPGKGQIGRRGPNIRKREVFGTSRLRETEDDPAQDSSDVEDDGLNNVEEPGSGDEQDLHSISEDEAPASNSYATLLQSLNVGKDNGEPARKKRRIAKDDNPTWATKAKMSINETPAEDGRGPDVKAEEQRKELEEDADPDEDPDDGPAEDADSEDEAILLRDPFERHYSAMTEQDLKDATQPGQKNKWKAQSLTSDSDIRITTFSRTGALSPGPIKSARDLFLKKRLVESGMKLVSSLSVEEKTLAGPMFNYVDILNGCRNLKNTHRLRELSCLHALNHVFKTRDRVLKNNARLRAQSNAESLDLRDQGFTRPKVLIMVPTKQACVRFVDSIVELSKPDQQENKARFLETFSHEDDDEWLDKPEDFQELFGGNHEEEFRIGLKFTRKTVKYFSGFYNSDIIIGSPLGLMRTITTGGGGKDKKKGHDADFLSSIEVVIVDHANALQMQNWQHVDYVFSRLNHLPQDSHGCDFSRVRHWYLDGQAKYLRQTVIFSGFLTPEFNALTSTHLHNITGRIRFLPTYPGAVLSISSHIPVSVPQMFLRVLSPNALQDSDARFKFFTTTVLPTVVSDAPRQKGTLLYTTSYADFVRLRNYLSTSPDTTNLSFGSISEYTPIRDVMRARSHFLSGRHTLLLYSERAHHHFRYKLKGVRRIVFYGIPENPVFWIEIVALLGWSMDGGKANTRETVGSLNFKKGAVKALFSKWDALKLERVVGTERVGRLLYDRAGDTFEFV
ncbi:uncharacterized protein Z518_01193 [Rhinocladiella mackenziei CBS 650.93]|uniref:U3 small nucleolar RNA-associated protein 25 n=1 Tax=Rhinocladiella mackenziei CBS 650.93 TaxID=1442369 RepID=A0A0D2G5I9_9EURO|nr:uncharacterized protein Z518_01193 [Rhinocladiella mackenziei CBS 650.93]KIX10112.1 hypothetical protein Z518_01193 [Rhinocladiella mackenziei CBS 650.93]